MFKAEKFDPRRVGASCSRRPGRSSSCRWPSTTTASRCTTAAFTDWTRGEDGAEARHRRRAGRGGAQPRAWSSALSSHRAEHWWFLDGGMEFDSDVKDPRYAGFYGPARDAEEGRGPERAARRRRTSTTGWRAPASWSTSTSRSSSGSTGGSSSRSSQPYLQTLRGLLLQPRRASGTRAWPSTTRTTPSPRRPPCSTSSAASSPASGPLFWQTDTSVSKNSWGYVDEPGLQDRRTRSSATWSTSSARTARCCSTSARGRTARSPSRSRRSCARSAAG